MRREPKFSVGRASLVVHTHTHTHHTNTHTHTHTHTTYPAYTACEQAITAGQHARSTDHARSSGVAPQERGKIRQAGIDAYGIVLFFIFFQYICTRVAPKSRSDKQVLSTP